MRRRSPYRRFLALVLLVALAGCYSYVPLEEGSQRIGDEVRVRVAEEAATSTSARQIRGDQLQGIVLASSQDSLTLRYRPLSRAGSFSDGTRRDTLTVALSELRSIERSQLDALKTGGLVLGTLGLVAGVAALSGSLSSGGSGEFGDGGDSPKLQIRLPAP